MPSYRITFSCPLCDWEAQVEVTIPQRIALSIAESETIVPCPCGKHGEGAMPKITEDERRQIIAVQLGFSPAHPESWPLTLIDRLAMVQDVMPGEFRKEVRKALRRSRW